MMKRWRHAMRSVSLVGHALVAWPLFLAIYYAAFLLRYEGQLPSAAIDVWLRTMVVVGLVKLIVFGWLRCFGGWLRYVTFHDLVVLGEAATLSALLIVAWDHFVLHDIAIPRSVVLIDWAGTIVAFSVLRGASRWLAERRGLLRPSAATTSVFIVGTNDSGESLLRAIRRNGKLPYRVVGFITERKELVGTQIGGVRVVGTLEDTCRLAPRYGASEVLITAGELSGKQVRWLVDCCTRAELPVRVLPSYEQLLLGKVDLQPRSVSIEDLLRREPAQLQSAQLRRWIEGQTILVTGSAGSIGSEICRQLLAYRPRRLVAVDRAETAQFYLERELLQLAASDAIEVRIGDINDTVRMERLLQRYRPDIIFHAAAYKHVPLMEANPGEAVKNIALATCRLADLADRYRCAAFVLISTDKAVRPRSVMGCCKRVAELYVQSLAERSACRFVSVRFGNVLDSAGSVVPIFRQQIAAGGPVTVTHPEMRRFFMTIPEASQLVIQAGAMGKGGEIFVLDMGEPVRIVDLAHDMIRLSGLRAGEDIEIQYIGLRPGEKLAEQLHLPDEQYIATSHPRIRAVRGHTIDAHLVREGLQLLDRVKDATHSQIIAALKQIVPEFEPETVELADDEQLLAQPPIRSAENAPSPAPADTATDLIPAEVAQYLQAKLANAPDGDRVELQLIDADDPARCRTITITLRRPTDAPGPAFGERAGEPAPRLLRRAS